MALNIDTKRLRIRPLSLSDTDFILALVNSPGWLQFIGDRNIKTTTAAEKYLQNGPMKMYHELGFGLLRCALRENDHPIGICGLLKRDELPHPDLGFALLPEFEGKGYAFEASAAIMDSATEPRVLAITVHANSRSISLLERLGFAYDKDTNSPDGTVLAQYLWEKPTDRSSSAGS